MEGKRKGKESGFEGEVEVIKTVTSIQGRNQKKIPGVVSRESAVNLVIFFQFRFLTVQNSFGGLNPETTLNKPMRLWTGKHLGLLA